MVAGRSQTCPEPLTPLTLNASLAPSAWFSLSRKAHHPLLLSSFAGPAPATLQDLCSPQGTDHRRLLEMDWEKGSAWIKEN
jgi:hypothetical protein